MRRQQTEYLKNPLMQERSFEYSLSMKEQDFLKIPNSKNKNKNNIATIPNFESALASNIPHVNQDIYKNVDDNLDLYHNEFETQQNQINDIGIEETLNGRRKRSKFFPTILLNNNSEIPQKDPKDQNFQHQQHNTSPNNQYELYINENHVPTYPKNNSQTKRLIPGTNETVSQGTSAHNLSITSDKKFEPTESMKKQTDQIEGKSNFATRKTGSIVDKNTIIHPGFNKYVIDEDHQAQNILPKFSEDDIKEAFNTLDLDKDTFITAEDLAFYLNEVLGENATDAEIEEMIRMLDYEGMGRVRYEEFNKMASGKSINPIGQAYPPTIDLFQNKKPLNEINEVNEEHASPLGYEPLDFDLKTVNSEIDEDQRTFKSNQIPDQPEFKGIERQIDDKNSEEQTKRIDMSNNISRNLKIGNNNSGLMNTNSRINSAKNEQIDNFKSFIKLAKINGLKFRKLYEKLKFQKSIEFEEASYESFLKYFQIEDYDVARFVFEIISFNKLNIDLR